ncbi:glycerol-3-phosphate acyltransferase 2, mitochondrial [Genypterus blacodes]|uniref:glycerol-3-phosphate acyltransferase 2, mitochondrial n=1 Tax=Genypterus blacodes TaxID=154954 RepID=UPI003F76C29B
MAQESHSRKPTPPPPVQDENRPGLFSASKLKQKLMLVVPSLGVCRPNVSRCCHQCTPDSLRKTLGQKSAPLGFRNVLSVAETHTRYRGWLVRRLCCVLFVKGCKVYPSPVCNRLERVCQSNRVKEALEAQEGGDGEGRVKRLSNYLPLINTCISPGLLRFVGWVTLKVFGSLFGSVEVNLNHVAGLQRDSQEGSPLVYVYVRQSVMDCALIPLVLLSHHLRVPYTLCPVQINSSWLRTVLQRVGALLLPTSALTEHDAEKDDLYTPVMAALLRELLHEGQAISVGVSRESGQGGQWLAHIRQLIKEETVPDVSVVTVGISYDSVPQADMQVGLHWILQSLWSLVWRTPGENVRIHLSQPFSLKEMCETGRCRVDGWLPLQDLLLPVILNSSTQSVFGRRMMSWLLPSHYASELKGAAHPDRDLSIALILHLIFLAISCKAVMSTSLVSSLLLYRHRKGVRASVLCADVSWLTEQLLFRHKDVGFGGALFQVLHCSLALLAPHLIIAAVPSRRDYIIRPRSSPAATHSLTLHAQIVTHAFIMEAVGACAVSAMLCEAVRGGVSSRTGADGEGEQVRGTQESEVVLGQSELTEKALQLCHLLPPGFMPPCQSSLSFALDAVDSLVRCGVLSAEEVPRDVPVCDYWKKSGALSWTTTDNPYDSDSDCEEQESHSYKLKQPSKCPEMLFLLCNMLAGHLRTLCWAAEGLELLSVPLPEAQCVAQIHSHLSDTANKQEQHYESCTEEAASTAARTLIDLGVLVEEQQSGQVFLGVSQLFQSAENRQKLHVFISQYLCD